MAQIQWSMGGQAVGTVWLPPDQINRNVVAYFQPGENKDQGKRCWIGNPRTDDDFADLSNFDHALKSISRVNNRIIRVALMHEMEKFDLTVVISFANDYQNPGEKFKVSTDPVGTTYLNILAVL